MSVPIKNNNRSYTGACCISLYYGAYKQCSGQKHGIISCFAYIIDSDIANLATTLMFLTIFHRSLFIHMHNN